MKRTTIIETIIFFFAILFLYTGISKFMDYETFKEQLSESPIVGRISSWVAFLVPCSEFLIVLMLVIPRWRLRGLYSALTLMASFTIYIIVLMSISDKLPCSCGGIISKLSWGQHIIFNSAFVLLSLWGILLQRREIRAGQKLWGTSITSSPSIIGKSL